MQLQVMTKENIETIKCDDKHYRFITGIITLPALTALLPQSMDKIIHEKLHSFSGPIEQLGYSDPKQATYSYAAMRDGIGSGYTAIRDENLIGMMKEYLLRTFYKKQTS